MKSTKLVLTVRRQTVLLSSILGLLTAGVQTTALARSPPPLPTQFSGLLNDYTPTTVDGPLGGATIKGAPYEMHGRWTMDLNPQRSKATFSAEMTMETSEVANASSVFDPGMLNPHVHHVSMTNGVVTTDWQRNCPAL
ncbi:MAG: hypothetical protein ABI128_03720, partial [Rhodanobacter sp.]